MKRRFVKKELLMRLEARLEAYNKVCIICNGKYKSFSDVKSFYKPRFVNKPKSKDSFYCCCSSCVLNKRNTLEVIEKALK